MIGRIQFWALTNAASTSSDPILREIDEIGRLSARNQWYLLRVLVSCYEQTHADDQNYPT